MDKEAIARELLAAEYERAHEPEAANVVREQHSNMLEWEDAAAIRAIVAALDQPTAILALQSSERGETWPTARDLFEIARPCFHYARRGTGDGSMFEAGETGRLLMRAMEAIAATLSPADLSPLRREGDADAFVIPRAIAEQVLSMGRAHWAATAELTDAGHLEHLAESLRLTREHFNFEDVPVPMHGLYLDGTETVLCHTGTSPNSGANAQALAGAWNWLFDQCAAQGPRP